MRSELESNLTVIGGASLAVPSTHINAFLLNGVLKVAKLSKLSCSVVMLDLSKALDNVCHNHVS